MNLGQFIDTFKEAIAQRVVESFPPLYRPSENGGKMPRLLRKPLGAQGDAIKGAALSLEAHRGTTVVGEMGTGKTFIAAAAAHMAGFRRILVLCPPHLVPKWKREVEMTVPGARAVIVKSITDLERLRLSAGSGPLFAVMSREKAKLSYRWMPAVIQRWATSRGRLLRDEETGEPFRVPCCPGCTAQIVDKDGVPLTDADLNRRKHTCAGCGGPLWQADKSGPARYPLADYVKHRMKGFFDLLIGDEVHEYKGRGSAQGIAAGVLADACGKSLSLSGTLMGGYSSTLFHLLYRFSPDLRTEFDRSDEHRWIQRYGFEEVTVGKDDDDAVEDGRNSRRRKFRKVVRERPGLVPSALFHIIGNTVFLRLSDVASGLPGYDEQILLSSMDSEEDATGYSQRSAYNTVYEELRARALRGRRGRPDDGVGPQDRQRRRGGGRGGDGGGGLRPGEGRRGQRRGVPGGRRLEGRRGGAGGHRCQRQRPSRSHRADGRAGPGQRPPRKRERERPRGDSRQRQRERAQRPPRGGPGAAAVALLLGGVHGRGGGQAQRPGRQDPGPVTVPVRVGGGAGAGRGAGRRGTLDRKGTGGGHHQLEVSSPCPSGKPKRCPERDAANETTQREATLRRRRTMARIFVYDDREFPDPDPDPQMSVDQVKATLSDFYGEIANASVKETKRGDDTIYEFQRRVGTKGTHARS